MEEVEGDSFGEVAAPVVSIVREAETAAQIEAVELVVYLVFMTGRVMMAGFVGPAEIAPGVVADLRHGVTATISKGDSRAEGVFKMPEPPAVILCGDQIVGFGAADELSEQHEFRKFRFPAPRPEAPVAGQELRSNQVFVAFVGVIERGNELLPGGGSGESSLGFRFVGVRFR